MIIVKNNSLYLVDLADLLIVKTRLCRQAQTYSKAKN